MNNQELKHYGVPGMKWGHRKAIPQYQQLQRAKANRKQANKNFNRAYRDANSWILNSQFDKKDNKRRNDAMMNAARKAEQADNAYKKAKQAYKNTKRAEAKAQKILKKNEKIKYKEAINKMAKEINAGESVVGRIYNKVTGADKIQAELMYAERHKK